MNGEQTVRDLAAAAREFDDIEEALAGAKKEMSRPRGAQYLDEKGRLVHVVPLADNCLALARSDRSVQILKGAAAKGRPTRSTFSVDGIRRLRRGDDETRLAGVLAAVDELLLAHVRFAKAWQSTLVATWVLGTYCHALFAYYGYIHATSPTRRCGKSLLLEILASICFNPTSVGADPSPAFIYRDCDRNASTQFFDELERLRKDDKDARAALMAVLNIGFKRGATVPRVVDPRTDELREYRVYSPKAVASIRQLADTTQDRTIRIELHRKRQTDRPARFDARKLDTQLVALRDDLHVTALQHAAAIAEFYDRAESLPLPEGVDDRARDILEPLAAIAALADAESGEKRYMAALQQGARDIAEARATDEAESEAVVSALQALRARLDGTESLLLKSDEALELFRGAEALDWLERKDQARRLLRQLGFLSGPHRRDGRVIRAYRIDAKALEELLVRYPADETRYEASQPAPGADSRRDERPVTGNGARGI